MTASEGVPFLYASAAAAVAAFGLWAYRFSIGMRRADLASAELRSLAMRKLQYASFLSTLAQLAFLVGAIALKAVAREGPIWTPLGPYLLMFLLQGQIRFAVEKRLRDIRTTQLEMLRLSVRGLLAMAAICGTYLLVALGGMRGVGALVSSLELVGTSRTIATWLASPFAVLCGIFAIGYLSPFLVRLMMPCERVVDPVVVRLLERCFDRAKLPTPAFWMLRMDRQKRHNAMVAGLGWGRGPFRRSLFFTRSLLEKLDPPEMEAILLHEISHVALRHIRNRLLFSVLAFVASLAPMTAITMSALLVFPARFAVVVSVLAYVVMLVTQVLVIRWLVRRQELEADAYGVLQLGGDAEAFASAMRKLLAMNDAMSDRKDPGSFLNAASAHPTAEYRIRVLREKAAKKARGERVLSPFEELRAAARRRAFVWAPVLLVLFLGTGYLLYTRFLP